MPGGLGQGQVAGRDDQGFLGRKGFDRESAAAEVGQIDQGQVQVGRQGNPLFNEALVTIEDKDTYSRTTPDRDDELFRRYADSPELAVLANALLGTAAITENRSDIAGIYIPDLIKVDLSTGPVALADDARDDSFHRLSVFGGDVLISTVQEGLGGGAVPGGWPNGRRFGDDVVDIALPALRD